jgi:hypothetical protein
VSYFYRGHVFLLSSFLIEVVKTLGNGSTHVFEGRLGAAKAARAEAAGQQAGTRYPQGHACYHFSAFSLLFLDNLFNIFLMSLVYGGDNENIISRGRAGDSAFYY